ncbi:MAG: hypothetical protein WC476_07790 [Phycisphaerae bacterium]|jgi:hypothetical protein
MNKTTGLASCVMLVFVFAGCGQETNHLQLDNKASLGGKNAFPESMVGIWEAPVDQTSGNKFGIKFEADGSVLKILYFDDGPVYLGEGESSGAAESEEAYCIFTMNQCDANYMPETGMLTVTLAMEHMFHVSLGEQEGRMEDYFEGPVSEDGKTWTVSWRHINWLKDAVAPEYNFSDVQLIFTKIDNN